MAQDTVGFIGLGTMGRPMVAQLVDGGFTVRVYDIDRDAVAAVQALGNRVSAAASPADIGASCEIVVTMLPSGHEVSDIVIGKDGVATAMAPGGIVLDTSSSQPWLTQALAGALEAKGIALVDAPVSGAREGAETGTLTFMVGGDAESVARCRPLLEAMGERIFRVGDVGAGHVVKSINNLLTATTYLATAEAVTIGAQYGIDPAMIVDVINESTGMNQVTQRQFKRRVLTRRFDSGFSLDLMAKDVGIALELARRMDLPLPVSTLGGTQWRAARQHLGGGRNIAEIVRWVEHCTGVELASDNAVAGDGEGAR